MKLYFFILIIISFAFVHGQSKDIITLLKKGDALLELQDFPQSKYFYELANKRCVVDSTCNANYSSTITSKVFAVDSIESYSSDDLKFVATLFSADSLLKEGLDIYAMQQFEEALQLQPSLEYPRHKIVSIIENSAKVKKQLMVLQSKEKYSAYQRKMKEAKGFENASENVKSYYSYLKIADEYHKETKATQEAAKLKKILGDTIAMYERYLEDASSFFEKGNYKASKEMYENAKLLNSNCIVCRQKLKYLDYYIKVQNSGSKKYKLQKNLAREQYDKGEYESAYYQYYALSKKNPTDSEVQEIVILLDKLLKEELDEKIKNFNANLLLERANELYMQKEIAKALAIYLKISNRYEDVIDYQSFLKLRIGECLQELEAD